MIKKTLQEIKNMPVLFWLTGIFTLIFIIVGFAQGHEFLNTVEEINTITFKYFGNYYLWYIFIVLIVFIGIGLSPLGKIKIGGQDAKAEHSFFSWFAMIFCAGMGVGILFWGPAEPLFHFMNPPLAGAETVAEKHFDALHLAFLHWGFSPWAIYGLTALAVGFFGFNLKKGFFFSSIITENDSENAAGWKTVLKPVVDFVTVVAIMFGVSASFAMAVMHLEGGIQNVFNIDPNQFFRLAIIVVITCAFMISSMRGLSKGIRVLSNISIILSVILMAGIAILGPKYDPGELLSTLPSFAGNFPALSLGTLEYTSPDWLREWTLPYWAWWIAFAPFVGIFVALISKGRSIRELVVAVLFGPAVFSIIWFIIFGNAALVMQIRESIFGNLIDFNNVNTVLFIMLEHITKNPILQWLTIALIATFFINSADSAAYTLASLSNDDIDNAPPKILQLGWGLMFTVLASLFLFTGGPQLLLKVLFVVILPFSVWLIVVFMVLMYDLVKYYRTEILGEEKEEKIKKPGRITVEPELAD